MIHISRLTQSLEISVAARHELPIVMEVIDEAAQWLLARGIRQWQSPPPVEAWDSFREYIGAGLVYLVRGYGSRGAIGTFRLEWHGGTLWPDDRQDAGCLYTLALRPCHVGRGFGILVIDWVRDLLRKRGKCYFRLDCISSNERLRRWYDALGFQYRRTGVDGACELALYELDLYPDASRSR
jgi:ribosomal protein S18 acetylase RimI-like enzyme